MRYNDDGTLGASPKRQRSAAWRLKGISYTTFVLSACMLCFGSLMLAIDNGEAPYLVTGSVCLASGVSCAVCAALALAFVARPEALRVAFCAVCAVTSALHVACFAVLIFGFADFLVFSLGGLFLAPAMLCLAGQVGR